MSENTLKIVPVPQAKGRPDAQTETPARTRFGIDRKRLRMILLVALPLIALVAGGLFYLLGGRYISTDNAYVGAQKILITPDISGKITHIAVHEGQHVKPGDELFTLDPSPLSARAGASAGQARRRAQPSYDKLKTNSASLDDAGRPCRENVELKQRDFDRKTQLVQTQAGSQADVDNSAAGLVTAQLQAAIHQAAARHDAEPAARQSRPAA